MKRMTVVALLLTALLVWAALPAQALGGMSLTERVKQAAATPTPTPSPTPRPVRVGDTVTFGHYSQTSTGTDNAPIEWKVLARDGQKALLISRYALDVQPYNTESKPVTWENCTLRYWLNRTFLNKAFTPQEQTAILLMNVDNSGSQGYSGWYTNGGNKTEDKVFLLSYAESGKYFKGEAARMCVPTEYAVKQGAYTYDKFKVDGKSTCVWWLRSPGNNQTFAAYVVTGGSRDSYFVNDSDNAVRPALWVNLESGFF